MQAYIIKPQVAYSGGCALVAAYSAEQALQIFHVSPYGKCWYDIMVEDKPVEGLTYDGEEPKVLFEYMYIE